MKSPFFSYFSDKTIFNTINSTNKKELKWSYYSRLNVVDKSGNAFYRTVSKLRFIISRNQIICNIKRIVRSAISLLSD